MVGGKAGNQGSRKVGKSKVVLAERWPGAAAAAEWVEQERDGDRSASSGHSDYDAPVQPIADPGSPNAAPERLTIGLVRSIFVLDPSIAVPDRFGSRKSFRLAPPNR